MSDQPPESRSHLPQMIGSLVAALLIIAITVALVTAKIGPGVETREREEEQEELIEQREDLQDEREDAEEERRDEAQEVLEERREELEDLQEQIAARLEGRDQEPGSLDKHQRRLLEQLEAIERAILRDARRSGRGGDSG